MNYYNALDDVKTKLLAVGATTCKIGIEKDISGNDYPIIRIVGVDNKTIDKIPYRSEMTFDVYFGADLACADLESIYQSLYGLEESIVALLHNQNVSGAVCKHQYSKTDEDRLPSQKMMVSRFYLSFLEG